LIAPTIDDRDTEAKFFDRTDHPVDLIIVLPWVAGIFDQPIDRPLLAPQWACHAGESSKIARFSKHITRKMAYFSIAPRASAHYAPAHAPVPAHAHNARAQLR
jgi:hypothetical protein